MVHLTKTEHDRQTVYSFNLDPEARCKNQVGDRPMGRVAPLPNGFEAFWSQHGGSLTPPLPEARHVWHTLAYYDIKMWETGLIRRMFV